MAHRSTSSWPWLPSTLQALTLLLSLLSESIVVAQTLPAPAALGPDAFTDQLAASINADHPPTPVRVVGPLTLIGRTASGQEIQINLDRIYARCRVEPAACPGIVTAYTGQTGTMLRQSPPGPTVSGLRVVVRPESYIRNLPRSVAADIPTSQGVLPQGLVALIVIDAPTSMKLLDTGDLQALHLTAEQGFAAALQNTARELQALDDLAKPVAPGFVTGFRGGAYESSRLLYPSEWSKLAARSGGHLLVAIPSAEEVLYANGAAADVLTRLSTLAHIRFARAERPTSAAVFEWRTNAWVVVAP